MLTRTSRGVTPLYREVYFQCTEVMCGGTYVAELTIIRTISPPARPKPGIILPMVAPKPLYARKGEQPAAANDDSPADDQLQA